MNYNIFICATEQSGDNIGFNIMSELLKKKSNIKFHGVGGSKMSPYFSNQFYSLDSFHSIGIVEIFFSINRYLKIIANLVEIILKKNYDLIITIDSPDFNYPLTKKLRNKFFKNKIIHIVAPTVWAWREYRAKNFSKVYDELLVLFDFEIKYFDRYGLKTSLMGHPVYYIKRSVINKNKNITIAFLPGSRKNELIKLLPFFKIAYKYLLINFPQINIFIPTLPHLERQIIEYTKNWKINLVISTDKMTIDKYFLNIDKALVCSGTASIEIAKRNIPQLVIYKLNYLTEIIARMFIKIEYANILNIIQNKKIIPEVTNSSLNNDSFLIEFKKLLHNNDLNLIQIKNVNNALKKIESNKPPYLIAANCIIEYL